MRERVIELVAVGFASSSGCHTATEGQLAYKTKSRGFRHKAWGAGIFTTSSPMTISCCVALTYGRRRALETIASGFFPLGLTGPFLANASLQKSLLLRSSAGAPAS